MRASLAARAAASTPAMIAASMAWLERRTPLEIGLLLGLIAQALFLIGAHQPTHPMFDEVHYLPAARAILTLDGPINEEHPLFAKQIIALSMTLFGDTPLGWRLASTLAGSGTVVALFAVMWRLTRSTRTAATAALLAMMNGLLFVQARIAMLDIFMGLFLTAAAATALAAPDVRRPAVALVSTGTLMGLSIASKWAAVPLCAAIGLALLVAAWRGGGWRRAAEWGAMVGGPAALVYLATFWPLLLYRTGAVAPFDLIAYQARMFALQTQVLAPHTYQSDAWTWPLAIRPIWYLYETTEGVTRGVLLLGNPAIMWGGLAAVATGLSDGWRHRRWAVAGPALLWLVAMGQWLVIPKKIGFYYYYYMPALILPAAIAMAFHVHGHGRRGWIPAVFLALACATFVHFYPILSAVPLAGERAFMRWMWLSTWP